MFINFQSKYKIESCYILRNIDQTNKLLFFVVMVQGYFKKNIIFVIVITEKKHE